MFPSKPAATPTAIPAEDTSGATAPRFARTISGLEAAAVDAVEEARLSRGAFAAAQQSGAASGGWRRMLRWLRRG